MPPEYKTDPKRLAVWKKLFGPLHRRRTLTKADSAVAELLVEDWILWQTVNAEAQVNPFSEVTWRDSAGNERSKRVESPATKMAASLQRSITQKLKEFSATPASREKTKKTTQPKSKTEPYQEGSIGHMLEEVERLKAEQATQQAPAEPKVDFDALLISEI